MQINMTTAETLAAIAPEAFLYGAPPRPSSVSIEYLLQPSELYTPEEFSRILLSPSSIKSATRGLDSQVLGNPKTSRSIAFANGAKLNVGTDVRILEYSTGMQQGPEEAATADLLGMIVMRDITRQRAGRSLSNGGLQRRTGGRSVHVDDNNKFRVRSYKSRGAMERLYTPRGTLKPEQSKAIFETFLDTYIIWSGSGMAELDGYELSQKAPAIGGHFDDSPTTVDGLKPLGIIESSSNDNYDIIEPRLVDATISPWQRTMSVTTKSIMLRLLEHGTTEQLAGLPVLVDTIKAPHIINKDTSMTTELDVMVNGIAQKMTAIDIQNHYLRACQDIQLELEFEKDITLPVIEQKAMGEWETALQDLQSVADGENGYALLRNRMDFAARRRQLGRTASLSSDKMLAVFANDMLWDYLTPGTKSGLSHWLETPTVFTPRSFYLAAKASMSNH